MLFALCVYSDVVVVVLPYLHLSILQAAKLNYYLQIIYHSDHIFIFLLHSHMRSRLYRAGVVTLIGHLNMNYFEEVTSAYCVFNFTVTCEINVWYIFFVIGKHLEVPKVTTFSCSFCIEQRTAISWGYPREDFKEMLVVNIFYFDCQIYGYRLRHPGDSLTRGDAESYPHLQST